MRRLNVICALVSVAGAWALARDDEISLKLQHQKALTSAPGIRGAPEVHASILAEIQYLQEQFESSKATGLVVQYSKPSSRLEHEAQLFEARNFTQPLDHFDETTDVTFNQRYFLAMQWYLAGVDKRKKTVDGREIVPVILYDGGETTLDERVNVLDNGILAILANATGGIGVLLEHRYYGTSIPNRSDLGPGDDWGVDQLRWLDTRQSLEDSAEFARRLHFEGVPSDCEYRVIYYGGSYAGARAAFLREQYPKEIFGAIASSAVVAATVQLPEYYYTVARGSAPECSQSLQTAIAAIDRIISPDPSLGSQQNSVNHSRAAALKSLFGLSHAPNLNDFANLLTLPLGAFQTLSWLQDGKPTAWSEFCDMLNNATVAQDVRENQHDELSVIGSVPSAVLGYAAYTKNHLERHCKKNHCGTQDPVHFRHDHGSLSTSKAWQFQICNEYGYYQVAPPVSNVSSEPPKSAGPKIVSSRIDEEYMSLLCRKGFSPGNHWEIPARPKVEIVNRIGNFRIAKDRLAIVDGQYDPWRPMTEHSDEYAAGGDREDTLTRPFKLIPNCWHHCDSDGLADPRKEPTRIQQIHQAQVEFVRHWLDLDSD
ncbi:hypothetical protein MYAM1_001924 [Malassezia yamatoensis]|uniref:Uncharacterized protein n=1 Tax=Malassezia yamatoensis TaxID=253288 RepID=A0AAJ5YS70_9BASI|nr:hypothetical protein MYAM1_001924 [Malassezia yamatoensis]